MALSMLKPNDAAPNAGLTAVALHHMRISGGMKDLPDSPSTVDRASPKTSPSIEGDDHPYKNLSPLHLLSGTSMLAHQMWAATAQTVYATQNWPPYSSQTSPPPTPVLSKTGKRINNNLEPKKPRRKLKEVYVDPVAEAPLSPPTSGSSPQSNGSGPENNCGKNSDKDKAFTCVTCNRSFGYKHVLQNHERTHTGEKPFECKECHKRFTRDHHLKTHMRLHTGEKPYHCEYCDRNFVQVANLRRHLRVHTGERPYSCIVKTCDSKFSDSNQLKAHMMIHNGEKPFECENCKGRFRRRHHLDHHKCSKKQYSPQREDMEDSDDDSTNLEIDEDSTRCSNESEPVRYPAENYLLSINNNRKIRGRKSRDIRRVIRPADSSMLPVILPEQTEPEDLSMPKSKLRNQLTQNNNHERRSYFSDADSRSESPPSASTSPSLERESFLYHHPKLRRP